MKKLMIMASVALCAVFAQAASVAWTITNVNGPDGNALGSGTAYMFFVAGSTKADTSAWAGLAGQGAAAMIAALADSNFSYAHDDLNADAGVWSYNKTTAGEAPENGDLGVVGLTKYSVYSVIFDSETITDSSKYMVTTATAASTTLDDAAGTTKTYILGSQATTSGTWYNVGGGAIPEPTSGMLLLLGIASLALRRKRA